MEIINMANISDALNKLVEHSANGLDRLATDTEHAVGTTVNGLQKIAPHIWHALVKQKLNEGLLQIVLCVFVCALLFVVYKYFIKNLWTANPNLDNDDNFYRSSWGCVAFVAVIITSIYFSFLLCDGILKMTNPEYYAALNLAQKIGIIKVE
jgi:hypothetical protein